MPFIKFHPGRQPSLEVNSQALVSADLGLSSGTLI